MGYKRDDVLVVSTYYAPIENACTNRIIPIVNGLLEAGHRVSVMAARGSSAIGSESISSLWTSAPKSNSSALRKLLGELVLAAAMLFAALFRPRPKLAIVTSPPFLPAIVAVFVLGVIRRIPIILDIRDLYPQVYIDGGLLREESFLHRFFRRIEEKLYKHSSIVVTVTDGMAEVMKRNHGIHAVVVKNGYDPDLFWPEDDKSDIFTLIVHGTIGRMQDTEMVVGTAAELHSRNLPVRVLLVGDGSGAATLENTSLMNLEYLGPRPKLEVAELVRNSHISLVIRRDDVIGRTALPVRALEALGAGLPIIAAPKSEFSRMVHTGGYGLAIETHDPKIIADAIERLMEDSELYDQFRGNIFKDREQYSYGMLSRTYTGLVSEVLSPI